MTLKQLVGRPKFKSVDFTIKSMVALITVSLIIGLLTIGFQSPVNWGGYHGRYVNNFIVHFFGWWVSDSLPFPYLLLCCDLLARFYQLDNANKA